jgi:hypothetical protein
MYLTDYRERSLKDVITQLEPALFKKVTGLDVKDFELLVSLNVFNGSLMNDAIFKFKRYEDSSLSYTGIDKHAEDESVGGWDTVIKREEYQTLFYNQQATLQAPARSVNELPDIPYSVDDYEEDEVEEVEVAPGPKPVTSEKPKPLPKAMPEKPDLITAAFGVKSPIPPKVEKPKFEVPRVTVGMEVEHDTFGRGKVIEFRDGLITVAFEQGQKRFEFPSAFENGFLKV